MKRLSFQALDAKGLNMKEIGGIKGCAFCGGLGHRITQVGRLGHWQMHTVDVDFEQRIKSWLSLLTGNIDIHRRSFSVVGTRHALSFETLERK